MDHYDAVRAGDADDSDLEELEMKINGGSMNHNHSKCQHVFGYKHPQDGESALKHCEHCDGVYCDLCKKEWGQPLHIQPIWQLCPYWRWQPTTTSSITYPYGTITNGALDNKFATGLAQSVSDAFSIANPESR